RDWAAKGTSLLGVRAVIAESFERIHRSNLVGMGVLPLQLSGGDTIESLGLTGEEAFSIEGLAGVDEVPRELTVEAGAKQFTVRGTCGVGAGAARDRARARRLDRRARPGRRRLRLRGGGPVACGARAQGRRVRARRPDARGSSRQLDSSRPMPLPDLLRSLLTA